MTDRLPKILFAIGVAVVLVILLGTYTEIKECEAKGGKRLRGILESYKCYDAIALKVLP